MLRKATAGFLKLQVRSTKKMTHARIGIHNTVDCIEEAKQFEECRRRNKWSFFKCDELKSKLDHCLYIEVLFIHSRVPWGFFLLISPV